MVVTQGRAGHSSSLVQGGGPYANVPGAPGGPFPRDPLVAKTDHSQGGRLETALWGSLSWPGQRYREALGGVFRPLQRSPHPAATSGEGVAAQLGGR